MGVAQVMDPDPEHPGFGAPLLHDTVEIALGQGEQSVIGTEVILHPDVITEFLGQEVRHLDHPVALRGLGFGDDVPAVQMLKGFRDGQGPFFKIQILWGQRQHLPFPDAAPVQYLECVVGPGFLHDGFCKGQILFPGPVLHLDSFFGTYVPDDGGRVFFELVVADGMVEHGAELVVNGLEVGSGVRHPGNRIPVGQHLVLPLDHIPGGNLPEPLVTQVGNQFGCDDVVLHGAGAFFDAGVTVVPVDLHKFREGHIQIAILPHLEVPLPLDGFPTGIEAPFGDPFHFALPVPVIELHIPGTPLVIFVDRHGAPP